MSAELDQLYQTIILEHSHKRSGEASQDVSSAGERSAVSHQYNPTCGDEITVRVTVTGGETPTVEAVEWNGEGCSISMAAASVLAETAPGLSLPELDTLIEHFRDMLRSRGQVAPDEEILGDAAAFAGVSKFVARVKCAMLSWVAVEDAVNQAASKTV
ncbi:SUF system NifU family Fe-S cluster assembly protein [Kocuria sp. cx-455]|uniref:Fe-S cluster assembly sulfur transfer protein SufU n=1 Tax=unclassified Candidatus Sulfotelmatobacter TaxID=2635724 RepID=UPI001685AA66|nr:MULTISPECIES: SUF system NifU family Fe-S cluster assembly protein [unclassified Candidatus Sulfotelmatobacter]MBD2762714.1 SUF system NifU family Fe-S cluster assembly protein [Kocuria sp. cx-116]MBD2765237.1 SUF system NifU family Fe-S cluster assembly protein [Kocuria sp. cx-455]